MIVTIVPSDNNVLVDGEVRTISMAGIDPAVHAVQWDGTASTGEIEYTRADGRRNEPITDIFPFQVFIDRWAAAAPPPPPPPPPKSAADLTSIELERLLVDKAVVTRGEIDAIKAARR